MNAAASGVHWHADASKWNNNKKNNEDIRQLCVLAGERGTTKIRWSKWQHSKDAKNVCCTPKYRNTQREWEREHFTETKSLHKCAYTHCNSCILFEIDRCYESAFSEFHRTLLKNDASTENKFYRAMLMKTWDRKYSEKRQSATVLLYYVCAIQRCIENYVIRAERCIHFLEVACTACWDRNIGIVYHEILNPFVWA